jgi:hypothetical protein
MTPMAHAERFPPTRLSADCGFRTETLAGMRCNGRDAPVLAFLRRPGLELRPLIMTTTVCSARHHDEEDCHGRDRRAVPD